MAAQLEDLFPYRNSMQYPFVYREEEALEYSDLYDATTDPTNLVPPDDMAMGGKSIVGRSTFSGTGDAANTVMRTRARFPNIAGSRVVSPVIVKSYIAQSGNPVLITDQLEAYRSRIQGFVGEFEAYSYIADHPNVGAKDIPKLPLEVLDSGQYASVYAERKQQNKELAQKVAVLRKEIKRAQGLLESIAIDETGKGPDQPPTKPGQGSRPAPSIFTQFLLSSKPPAYEQGCRIIWSTDECFILLGHLKYTMDTGTDIFIARIDTSLKEFRQENTSSAYADTGVASTITAKPEKAHICTLEYYFPKHGNQLFIRFLCTELLKKHAPVLSNCAADLTTEPKILTVNCTLTSAGLALGEKQEMPSECIQITLANISTSAAKETIANITDAYQRLFAQLHMWGIFDSQNVTFAAYMSACPRFYETRSDKLVNFLASQSVPEPDLKLLRTKSTTVQTFTGGCIYCKLYTSQSFDSVVVRLSFKEQGGKLVLSFTSFCFYSGDTISDSDVRMILTAR